MDDSQKHIEPATPDMVRREAEAAKRNARAGKAASGRTHPLPEPAPEVRPDSESAAKYVLPVEHPKRQEPANHCRRCSKDIPVSWWDYHQIVCKGPLEGKRISTGFYL